MHAPLTLWLRLLWGMAPPLAFDTERAYIAAGAIHLPARTHWQHHTAAAAHAAAHLVYSPRSFDGTGLGPIARTLLALLEDARVEALAVRELPGLARVWRPLHTATPDAGVGFESLAVRLARSLCDPSYDDPEPWVRKGRDLCFLDIRLSVPAMRTPAELRDVAMRLGHDIGQMRLPFNGRAGVPLPAYRDDHRWMWAADGLASALPPPLGVAGAGQDTPSEPNGDDSEVAHHPEWDRLIERLRPDACRVVETAAPDAPAAAIADTPRAAARRRLGPVRDLACQSVRPACSETGEAFDLAALAHWPLGRRLRRPGQTRIHRGKRVLAAGTAVWLLIDPSASTAPAADTSRGGSPGTAARSSLALGPALRARGVEFGVAAFSANGRHLVQWRAVKTVARQPGEELAGRLQSLRSERSTRLSAVLRQAMHRLAAGRGAARWVVLRSGGSGVHDPACRVDDARRAWSAARRHGLRVGCLVFLPDPSGDAARTVAGHRAVRVRGLSDLSGALRRQRGRCDRQAVTAQPEQALVGCAGTPSGTRQNRWRTPSEKP